MKRTNFYFSEELLERVRAYAEKTGQTSSDVIRAAIEEYLLKREEAVGRMATVGQQLLDIQAAVRQVVDQLNRKAGRRVAKGAKGGLYFVPVTPGADASPAAFADQAKQQSSNEVKNLPTAVFKAPKVQRKRGGME